MDASSNGTHNVIPPQTLASPTNQFAVLDLLIPGFSTISTLISTYTGQDLNLYIPTIVLLFVSVWAFQIAWYNICKFFRKYCMTCADVRIDDEMYNHVMGWIAVQPFSSKSKMFVAQSSVNSKNYYMWIMDRFGNSDKEEGEDEEEAEIEKDADGLPIPRKKKEKPIAYTPGMGTHLFW